MSFLESDHWILLSLQDQEFIDAKIDAILRDNAENKKKFTAKQNRQIIETPKAIRCGYRAEYALSRYLNLKWSNEQIGNYHKPDLEYGIEVKATDKPAGNLWCSQTHLDGYLRRDPNTPLVCVVMAMWPWVEFHGFLYAREVQRYPYQAPGFRGNAGYLAPRDKLRPMEKFKELVEYWKKSFPTSEN